MNKEKFKSSSNNSDEFVFFLFHIHLKDLKQSRFRISIYQAIKIIKFLHRLTNFNLQQRISIFVKMI